MFSKFFSEILNPDLFSICGKELTGRDIKIKVLFTLRGEEENESALDPTISIAYFALFFRLIRRRFNKVTIRRTKVRRKIFQESMTLSFQPRKKEEIFYLFSFFGGIKKKRKDYYEIRSLRSFKPYPFVDLEGSLEIDRMNQSPIEINFTVKKNRSLLIFRQILCQPI